MLNSFGKFVTKIFGSKSEKDIKKIQPIVEKIKSYDSAMQALSDDELKAKNSRVQKDYQKMLRQKQLHKLKK
jgi:Preprotein translocase subunit SecA (ATPase, RNA helicase)